MSAITELLEKIKNPGKEYSPIPFWFLNDDFSDDEIVRQLEEFNSKGVNGVVLHPRIGIPKSIKYLSDKYMHFIEVAIKTAARLGMKIVLYDEAMYPSGSAHGMVVASNPNFAAQAIFLTDDCTFGKIITKTSCGKYIVQGESGGKIRGIHWGEDDEEPNAPRAADLLSKYAVDKFIELTHERYYNLFGEFFGNTIIGFFTDEPMLLGREPRSDCYVWTWGFEDEIIANGGNLDELEGLFNGENNKTVELYKRLVFEKENTIFYKSLSDWCIQHKIELMGHPHKPDDIECESFFGVPGQDIVLRRVAPEMGALTGRESVQAKCSSDAARIMGKRRNSNECYGACCRDRIPWYFTGADLKWYTDWLGVRGVNMFIPHAFYYSIKGKRKDERPPDVGPNNIWWKYFDKISTYIKRISYIMTDCRNTAKVAVMCENRNMPSDKIAWLYQNQIEFNYLPYNFVTDEMYRDGKLFVGENEYEFICNDWKNRFPEVKRVDSLNDITHREIYTNDNCDGLRVTCVVKNNVKMWFLTNEGESDIDTDAYLIGNGNVIKMDLWSGDINCVPTINKNNKAHFKLYLPKFESRLIILGNENFPLERKKEYVNIRFNLTYEDKENFKKIYNGKYLETRDNLYVSIFAEEMVECFVNGKFVGVSLWNKHEFFISPYLSHGENLIELIVTGNAANRFTTNRIPYGLNK